LSRRGRSLPSVDAYLAVASKREVREYAPRALPDDAARRILEAGRIAGSSRNRQARRFVVLRDRQVVERAAEAVHNPGNLLGAALVVAVVTGGKGPLAFDAARAAQNMMLAAWNDGIGSCPNGIRDPDRLRDVLGHGDDEQVATILSFGYPARARDPERRSADEWIARADRRPFDDVVSEL
jgi:nitroreductase